MQQIIDLWPTIFCVLILVVIWYVVRKILNSVSNKINNAELYKEDILNVLEEIRNELKELNRNNSIK
ncbi:hypothetical protein IRZ71_18630 [Flavobacterium sp. ANB]|uniref:hypothetical protein n=1 Tax=unclassified Flavobacterium TaxID=196869 RepID=UPI0012B8CA97|nr:MULTISPECIES: hypothetical protein [unclassified Flavobacterium]MBF4518376.1 hypothetical protein [Flavobacterium sp. ANB]MTD70928.1 hypothetical protein [Flavobacterium sp. LC2016-13]